MGGHETGSFVTTMVMYWLISKGDGLRWVDA